MVPVMESRSGTGVQPTCRALDHQHPMSSSILAEGPMRPPDGTTVDNESRRGGVSIWGIAWPYLGNARHGGAIAAGRLVAGRDGGRERESDVAAAILVGRVLHLMPMMANSEWHEISADAGQELSAVVRGGKMPASVGSVSAAYLDDVDEADGGGAAGRKVAQASLKHVLHAGILANKVVPAQSAQPLPRKHIHYAIRMKRMPRP
jgi:hypothetical protein